MDTSGKVSKKNFKMNKGKLIVTETIEIEDPKEYKAKLQDELRNIVKKVKDLKSRAEEIKEMLSQL